MGLLAKKYGLPWGKIHGHLICTPEQALRNWGFTMKEGADGVYFRVYSYTTSGGKTRKATFINNFVTPVQPNTAAQIECRDRYKVLRNITHNHLCDLIHPIWNPERERKGKIPICGWLEFISQNLFAIDTPPNWEKLIISTGRLEPTNKVTGITYNAGTGVATCTWTTEIYGNGQITDKVGLFVFLESTKDTWHFEPNTTTRIDGTITETITAGLPIAFLLFFVYFNRDTDYSTAKMRRGA